MGYVSMYDITCKCCGKKFSLFFYDRQNYVYKLRRYDKTTYFCSYPCYRKEKIKIEQERITSKRPSQESNRLL